jgi:hypothetical protein
VRLKFYSPTENMRPKQKSLKTLEREVSEFNTKHKVGDRVNLLLDSGELREVEIYNEATILGNHSAVGWFKGVSGCYPLSSVRS